MIIKTGSKYSKMDSELKAPQGKTRVVGVDLFSHEDYVVGDYNTRQEAINVAEQNNQARTVSIADIYYVYDDSGLYVPSNLGSTPVRP